MLPVSAATRMLTFLAIITIITLFCFVECEGLCKDTILNCDNFHDTTCTKYPWWAKKYCAATCGVCKEATTSTVAPPTIHPTTPPTTLPATLPTIAPRTRTTSAPDDCEDKVDNCLAYNQEDCLNYMRWARMDCAKTCGFCPQETTTTAPTTTALVTTIATTQKPVRITCEDLLDNCDEMTKDGCGAFSQYAKVYCQSTCGYCKGNDCTDSAPDFCANDFVGKCHDYDSWAQVYCRKTCGICKRSDPTTLVTTLPPTVPQSPSLPSTQSDCRDGWSFYAPDRTCLKAFGEEHRHWPMARAVCQVWGGDLAVIRDRNKNYFVLNMVGKVWKYWVGIQNKDNTGFDFQYVDGSLLGEFHPWSPNNPDNLNKAELCVAMYSNGAANAGLWLDYSCEIDLPFVCSTPPLEDVMVP